MGKLSTSTGFGLIQEKPLADEKHDLIDLEQQEKYKKELNKNWMDFVESLNGIISYINSWTRKVRDSVNRINLVYQHQGNMITVTITAADTDTAVAHNLKYIPQYWIVVDSNIEGYMCKGNTSWTSTNCYFRAGNTGVAKIIVW